MSSERMIPLNPLDASSEEGLSLVNEAVPWTFPVHGPTVDLSDSPRRVVGSKRH